MAGVHIHSEYPDDVVTDADGKFAIRHHDSGDIQLTISMESDVLEFIHHLTPIRASDSILNIDLGDIPFHTTIPVDSETELPAITLDEDEQESGHISGLLQSADEPFARITSYTFSPARFSRRGLTMSIAKNI